MGLSVLANTACEKKNTKVSRRPGYVGKCFEYMQCSVMLLAFVRSLHVVLYVVYCSDAKLS